jgi:hypothetical protein
VAGISGSGHNGNDVVVNGAIIMWIRLSTKRMEMDFTVPDGSTDTEIEKIAARLMTDPFGLVETPTWTWRRSDTGDGPVLN